MNAAWMGWEFARRGYVTRRLPSVQKQYHLELRSSGLLLQAASSGNFLPLLATPYVTTQNSAVLSYFAAEAWKHAFITCITLTVPARNVLTANVPGSVPGTGIFH